MDNEKYQRIEYLLQVMHETFGFDLEEAASLPKDVVDEEALGGKESSRSQETNNNRDEKNATIEMNIRPNAQ